MSNVFFVVAYDIPDDGRREKVARTLEDFGDRVQYSVFELLLDSRQQLEQVRVRLLRILDPASDSVRVYSLCAKCHGNVEILGTGSVSVTPSAYVL